MEKRLAQYAANVEAVKGYYKSAHPPPSRTDRTRRVPLPVLIGHAASLTRPRAPSLDGGKRRRPRRAAGPRAVTRRRRRRARRDITREFDGAVDKMALADALAAFVKAA
jgi:hypothetical protein